MNGRAAQSAMVLAVLLRLGVNSAHAEEPAPPPVIPPQVAERAGISREQQEEIARLTVESNAQLVDLQRKHRSAQQALEKLLKASQPPEAVVMTQIERVGAAEAEVRKNRVALMLRIRAVLGPEVWANLQMELEIERRIAERQRGYTPRAPEIPRVGEPIQMQPVSGTLHSGPR